MPFFPIRVAGVTRPRSFNLQKQHPQAQRFASIVIFLKLTGRQRESFCKLVCFRGFWISLSEFDKTRDRIQSRLCRLSLFSLFCIRLPLLHFALPLFSRSLYFLHFYFIQTLPRSGWVMLFSGMAHPLSVLSFSSSQQQKQSQQHSEEKNGSYFHKVRGMRPLYISSGRNWMGQNHRQELQTKEERIQVVVGTKKQQSR